MDDSNPSRASDASAARKRRSSILKSQRSHRAPLSELEFNVTTPTDTNKSRRVSFSKLTGVAEFVTNEATTTWKNFYEEHNKSLESSGNESGAHRPRQSVGHLGKRIFEDQFQVEAIDFSSTPNNAGGIDTSINNVKFALDCTNDNKLTIAEHNFELSQMTVTQQPSKLFSDDLAMSGFGEVTDKINVNFSTLQPVVDDLEEIQKDLIRIKQQKPQNVVCQGPDVGQYMSEYIEIDLNATHMAIGHCDSTEDMSITDTIHSPKVNVSKNSTSSSKILDKDWVADKENIAVNPYVAPDESDHFAVNKNPEQILVFDGKRLTIQSEKEPVPDYKNDVLTTVQPLVPPRKTIVLNTDDDLPNFIENPHNAMHHSSNMSNRTILGTDCDISMTQAVSGKLETAKKRQTVVFDNSSGDISITQSLPTHINEPEKRRTIVFDNVEADISVTQAVPVNFISEQKLAYENKMKIAPSKRKTIVFEDEAGNISITKALPTNIIMNSNKQITLKQRSILFQSESGNVSVTEVVDTKSDKRNTIVFNNEENEISITKAIPANIILSNEVQINDKSEELENKAPPKSVQKRSTIVFDEQDCDISITKAIPANLILSQAVKPVKTEQNEIKTIISDGQNGDISITTAITTSLCLPEKITAQHSFDDSLLEKVKCQNDGALQMSTLSLKSLPCPALRTSRRSKISISYDDDNQTDQMDVSMTQALPSNILLPEIRKSLHVDADISLTQAVPGNLILSEINKENNKSQSHEQPSKMTKRDLEISETHPKLAEDISFTASVSGKFLPETEIECNSILYEDDYVSMTKSLQKDVILSEISGRENKNKGMLLEPVSGNISACKLEKKSVLIVTQSENIMADQSVSMDMCSPRKDEKEQLIQNKTALDESKVIDLTMTELAKDEIVIKEEGKHFDIKTLPIDETIDKSKSINLTMTEPSKDDVRSKEEVQHFDVNILQITTVLTENVKTSGENQDLLPTNESEYINKNGPASVKTSYESDGVVGSNSHSLNKEEHSENLHSFVMAQMGSAIHPIPQDLINLEKVILTTELCLKNTDGRHLNDVMVYQATTKSDMRPETFEQNSSISSKSEVEPSADDSGRVINTDYVTVTIKMPQPLHSTDLDTSKGRKTEVHFDDKAPEIQEDVSDAEMKNDISKTTTSSPESRSDDINYKLIESDSAVDKIQKTIEKSILNDLLDMDESFAPVVEPIPVVEEKSSNIVEEKSSNTVEEKSSNTVEEKSSNTGEDQSTKTVEASLPENTDNRVQSSDNSLSENRFYIINDSNNETQTEKSDDVSEGTQSPELRQSESFLQKSLGDLEKKLLQYERPSLKGNYGKQADTTKELLDMLSKFTEKEEMYNPIVPIMNSKKSIPDGERKGILRRQSSVLSREDLAHSISMANAMLHKSCVTDPMDDSDLDSSPNRSISPKSVISHDVVKTLRFEDEDYTTDTTEGVSIIMTTPLKKTAFGETSYMTEEYKKGRVIPTYLKDVSDGLKSIMSDLVKPMVDVGHSHAEPTSKANSKQIQANLQTSSQIDVTEEPSEESLASKDVPRLKSIIKTNEESVSMCSETTEETKEVIRQPSPPIIRFDPTNPLNNVLIAPPVYHNVHKYKPTTEEHSTNRYFNVSFKDEDTEDQSETVSQSEDRTSTQYGVPRVIHNFQSPRREIVFKSVEKGTICSTTSSVSQSVETVPTRTSDAMINTVIAMQDSKKLLENVSSLTLVESANENESHQSKEIHPTNVMDMSTDSVNELAIESHNIKETKERHKKHAKRRHSKCALSALDVTPKAATKKPKRSSDSGDRSKRNKSIETSLKEDRTMPVIVHNCMTVFCRHEDNAKCQEGVASRSSTDTMLQSLSSVSSKDMGDQSSLTGSMCQQKVSRVGWQPELLNELSSKNLLTECESGADVLRNIQQLPFMGSTQCEWESVSKTEWSFRLLHRRLRLTVTFHPLAADPEGCVRADTPVKSICVDTDQQDKLLNSAAVLCVGFARESMRYWVAAGAGGGCTRAGDVPGLLRRCAVVARVALRWGRAMHDAWLRLAYTLTNDGALTLKVANVPLRSVWEVSMQIELVVGDSACSETPWPRATAVRVAPVVSEAPVSAQQVARALDGNRQDWGHAPRTIWKIFRYLKNRTREDESVNL